MDVTEATRDPAPSEERGRELRALLARRLAHLGWEVHAELVDTGEGPMIECVSAPAGLLPEPPHRLRFPLSMLPLVDEVDRMIGQMRAAGWSPSPTRGRAPGGLPEESPLAWCAAEL